MDPKVGAALASGGLSALTSVLGINESRKAEERAFNRSKELMRLQNDFNVQMWNRSNEYNSPANQLRLLKEAGVNPAVSDFFGGSGSTASEVTSATADAPYNSQIGELYQKADPSEKALQALATSAQMEKLRTDIQYQKMLNEDYKLRLEAYKEGLPLPLPYQNDAEYASDANGNPVVTVLPQPTYNFYQEQRAQGRLNLEGSALRNSLTASEYEVYEAGKEYLKKMSKTQLENLEQDLRAKILDNSLLEEDVSLMKKYGISPHDQSGWTSFLKVLLREPDALHKIIGSLTGSLTGMVGANYAPVGRAIQRGYNLLKGYGNSHSNPKRKR